MERLSAFERDEIVSAIEKEVMDKFGKQSQEIIRLKDEIGELKNEVKKHKKQSVRWESVCFELNDCINDIKELKLASIKGES